MIRSDGSWRSVCLVAFSSTLVFVSPDSPHVALPTPDFLTPDYDAISLSPLPVSPASFHTTVFPVTDQTILTTADKLVSQLRARHYYTDTANFDLRCAICKTGLRGEKGAREHAMQTGRELSPVDYSWPQAKSNRCRVWRVLRLYQLSFQHSV